VPGCDRPDFDRYCRSHGEDPSDLLHEKFWQGLMEREADLSRRRGRVQHANYMWRSIRNKGVIRTMEGNVLGKKPKQGFLEMVAMGQPELSDEYQVLEFSSYFSPQAAMAAEARLREFNCPLP
jgi:hypothetical protein